jgi:spermidine synthase
LHLLLHICSDPKSAIPFAKALYSNETFTKSFYDSLSDDGILVMQLGQAADQRNPDETHSKYKNRVKTVNLLEKVGFRSILAYEEVRDHHWTERSQLLLLPYLFFFHLL